MELNRLEDKSDGVYKFRNYWSPEQIEHIPMFKKQLLDLIWQVYWLSEDKSRLFSLLSCDRTNSYDRKFHLKRKKLFYCECNQKLEQVAQWGFVVSIHGDTLAKHGCEKSAAAAPALNLNVLQMYFPASAWAPDQENFCALWVINTVPEYIFSGGWSESILASAVCLEVRHLNFSWLSGFCYGQCQSMEEPPVLCSGCLRWTRMYYLVKVSVLLSWPTQTQRSNF